MKELQSIVNAYYSYKSTGINCALATVVKVEGSAYRRPGARMLVSESGQITGAISGGCLEGDALRKAQAVMFQRQSMLAIYDTTDEDDQKFGVGLGCNGIIYVLLEPLDYKNPNNPVLLIEKALEKRISSKLLTVFSITNSRSVQIGTVLLSRSDNFSMNEENISDFVMDSLYQILKIHSVSKSTIVSLNENLEVFIEVISPTVQVVLFGAGNDTIPLAKMIDVLGWKLVLVDGRKQYATAERFPTADEITVGSAEDIVGKLNIDSNTVALLMTHNFDYELRVLKQLLHYPLPYIGILGPQKKTQKLFSFLTEENQKYLDSNIFGPVGLNIGAEGAEEIALSILAEIKSVLNKTEPYSLRLKSGPIHE
ncbi:XdhC family protein [Belliella sp. DSM 111904]|uniref:XdhC family protein n=1 Tax=Belliella filtrata TaxID=2923435 RepID=A0ABS9V4B8_9BACT|nr:XdhC/CoxI family protein [Belliella filtrata]MCH7411257.1 XdhC family protein [Belliella filtrata]